MNTHLVTAASCFEKTKDLLLMALFLQQKMRRHGTPFSRHKVTSLSAEERRACAGLIVGVCRYPPRIEQSNVRSKILVCQSDISAARLLPNVVSETHIMNCAPYRVLDSVSVKKRNAR